MIKDYDDYEAKGEDETEKNIEVSDFESELVHAKTFLQTSSSVTGENLYDHLTDVLNKILAERPENVIDFFEEYSRKVKEKRFKPMTDHLEDVYVNPIRYALARKWQPLLLPMMPDEPSTVDPEDLEIADMTRNNMLQLLFYFEQAGVGLPRPEMFALMLSMMRAIKKEPLASIRFWGKIYGDYKNYYVIETELKEEEIIRRNEIVQNAKEDELRLKLEAEALKNAEDAERARMEQETQGEDQTNLSRRTRPLPPTPKSTYEEPPEPPEEPSGVGVNKKVYFVCNEIGDEWVQLPDLTPKQVRISRLIKKNLTGNLNQEISTYPEFPGNEGNYLRAQIARISAGTQISPLGFYTFAEVGGEGAEEEEEEAEEEEEGGGGGAMKGGDKTSYKENVKFEGLTLHDMLDASMSFWVHHTMYILPQGRTVWWGAAPVEELGEEMGEGEEDEDKPKATGPEPETGPPLLTPLSEDSSLETVAAWSVRQSSSVAPNFAIAIVRSNIWPGAFCFATQGKLFENIYFGDGLKYTAHNFSPKPLPPIEQDYPLGPEIMEIDDPTGAEEESWRIAHLPKEKVDKADEGGEEEEEEEEEDEDDDDDDDD